jgi:carboxyl-terminal processing protease
MRRIFSPPRLALALLTSMGLLIPSLAAPSLARAQVLAPATSNVAAVEIEQLLTKGEEFERARRWAEALGHYESAIKQYPDHTDLSERLSRSRIRFDLARRYADSSFTRSLTELTTADALEMYGEVLLKVQTHYVDVPDWSHLVTRGVASLDAALTEPDFIARNLKNVELAKIEAFRATLAHMTAAHSLRTRQDVQKLAADVAYRAAQDLGLGEPAVILEFTCGALSSLDTYSSFLTAAQLEDVFSQIEGNFVGLGIELKTLTDALQIVGVIEGSPAQRGGIKVGDKIIGVDAATTRESSPDAVADMLKGPEGSNVTVTIIDAQTATRRLRLVRQRVDVPSVDRIGILDRESGVGYFRITSFQKTTSRDVDAALWKLQRDGMRFLIVDVRGNPGGLLTGAVEIADKFVQQGTIVSTRGRSAAEDFDYKAHTTGTWRVPMAVLIDGDSASASEIFAGAIHDHRRGTIVGTQSYGKGSVQGIFPLNVSKAGVRLTTAKFYSPSGQAISKRGVTPDLVVRSAAKPVVEDGEVVSSEPVADAVLEAGIQLARNQVSKR